MHKPEGHMFKLPERTTTFTFDNEEWAGAEIVCRISPIRISEVLDVAGEQTWKELIVAWARIALVSWNLTTPDDKPIPCDIDGLDYLPFATQMALVEAWLEEVGEVPAPLLRRSSAGVSSEPEPEPVSLPS